MRRCILSLAFLVLSFFGPRSLRAYDTEYFENFEVVASDGIAWNFEQAERMVIIGDIHGDFDALITILLDRKLIDLNGYWIGGATQLVLLGDLAEKGSFTRLVFEYVIDLQQEIELAGGQLLYTIGNHDFRMAEGDLKYTTDADVENFDGRGTGTRKQMAQGFRGDTRIAKWLRQQNSIVRVGRNAFVHAALRPWALMFSIDDINATGRAHIRYAQGVDTKPPDATEWITGAKHSKVSLHREGPWKSRAFSPRLHLYDKTTQEAAALTVEDFEAIKAKLDVDRVFVGHEPTESRRIMESPVFAGVILTDTAITRKKDGQLSAVEINDGELSYHYMERFDGDVPFKAQFIQRIFGCEAKASS